MQIFCQCYYCLVKYLVALPIGPVAGLVIVSLLVVGCITLDCIGVSLLMFCAVTTGEIGFFLTGSWK